MKKMLALVCALAMIVSMSACAFADYTPSGEFNIRVFAKAGGVADIDPYCGAGLAGAVWCDGYR